ncbi:hypothetical protein B0X71_02255 [Planococcus lenghuensis]|uniref:Uncharacterized protein n=1 Tax=Planococcus lenghuensis TaxID=2213202 RepID=A0A1Q2KV09_9BACL|nr:hypothetical protein B0X71_02255 [Planococcus lenghuensis]
MDSSQHYSWRKPPVFTRISSQNFGLSSMALKFTTGCSGEVTDTGNTVSAGGLTTSNLTDGCVACFLFPNADKIKAKSW